MVILAVIVIAGGMVVFGLKDKFKKIGSNQINNLVATTPTDYPVVTTTSTPTTNKPKTTTKPTTTPKPTVKPTSTPIPNTSNNQTATSTPWPTSVPATSSPVPTSIPTTTPSPTSAEQIYQSGLITAKIICAAPHDGWTSNHIELSVLDGGVETRPNGVWTYVINNQGENIFLAYTGPDASNASATVHGSVYSIPYNGKQLILTSGVSYTAKFSHGAYTSVDPNSVLTDVIAQVGFTPVCSF